MSQSSPMKMKKSGYHTAPKNYNLDIERQNMVWDLDEQVPEVTRAFFEQYLLPPSRLADENSLKHVVDRLRNTGKIDENGFWAGWVQPSVSSELEDTIFKDFESLTRNIVEAAKIPGDTIIDIKCNPAFSLGLYARKNTSKPDCYGILKKAKLEVDPDTRKSQPKWLDVATPGEFKKKHTDTDFVDDATKVLWSMNQIMREDPRRCFIIGFTIENSSMRYWYCSRSDVFVSEAFDMLTQHEILVDFITRMSFATEAQLGWDPSIELHKPSVLKGPGGLQYNILVQDHDTKTLRRYRTQRVISSIGAEALRGRGTRVWEVRELNAEQEMVGEPCVLKDSWVNSDRDREGEILAKIRKAAARRGPQDAIKRRIDRSLLTVITYGDVCCNERVDKTCHWTEAPQHTDVKIIQLGPKASNPIPPSLTTVGARVIEAKEGKKTEPYVAWSSKVHHRIVFKEICKTIHDITSLAEAFYHLVQIVAALKCLHELGWVHRDISSGNIMVFNGVAKLADLEYAKHESDTTIHGIRTGTPYFMSVEVECTSYLVGTDSAPSDSTPEPTPAPTKDAREDTSTASDSEVIETFFSSNTEDSSSDSETEESYPTLNDDIPFKYNPLHDMESLMWLGWFLLLPPKLRSIGPALKSTLDAFTVHHQTLANKLFVDKTSRTRIMTTEKALMRAVARATLHDQVRKVALKLLLCHFDLRKVYNLAERNMVAPVPFGIAKAQGLYQVYSHKLSKIAQILRREDIVIAPHLNSCDRLRKDLCLEQPLNGDKKPKPSRGDDGNAEPFSGRPLKKQKTVDDRDVTSALASRTSQLHVGSQGDEASVHPSHTESPSSAATEPTDSVNEL